MTEDCNMCFDKCLKFEKYFCRCCFKFYCGSCRDTIFVMRKNICYFCINKGIKNGKQLKPKTTKSRTI